MNETMLALLGFVTIIAIVIVLVKNYMGPAMTFITVTFATAVVLMLTGTNSITEIGGFVEAGVNSTSATACMFLFSVLFFGIMSDAGMFDVIISALMKRVGDSLLGVALMTCLITMICHLDGSGAATFLIVVPAMLPIYQKLHMRPTTLLKIMVVSMGAMNLLPWGGPTIRVATILNMDPNVLWKELIPMQLVGLVLGILTAIYCAAAEKKRGAGIDGKLAKEEQPDVTAAAAAAKEKSADARPKLFLFNIAVTLLVIAALICLDVPSYYPFMIGCAAALLVNYPSSKQQSRIIKHHADAAIMMASTLFGAGVFLGMLDESGIMMNMAQLLAGGIPASLGAFLPLIIGVLSVPLSLGFSTDSYFYGILPVLVQLGSQWGVDPLATGIAMVVCRNCATFITPAVPATFLGCGLAGIEIKDHIKANFMWVWGVSIICLIAGMLLGIV